MTHQDGRDIDAGCTRKGDWIQTFTGRQFWPMDPRPDDIDIVDIAHALSRLCRFGGHCERFYSVAEHSVLLSRHVKPRHRLWALLHDASEAYLVDVPRPIKRFLIGYEAAEEAIQRAVCEHFGIDPAMPVQVKEADRAILSDEAAQNMKSPPIAWSTASPGIGAQLKFWTPDEAKARFLSTFLALRSRTDATNGEG